jgi:hypothetical protein
MENKVDWQKDSKFRVLDSHLVAVDQQTSQHPFWRTSNRFENVATGDTL